MSVARQQLTEQKTCEMHGISKKQLRDDSPQAPACRADGSRQLKQFHTLQARLDVSTMWQRVETIETVRMRTFTHTKQTNLTPLEYTVRVGKSTPLTSQSSDHSHICHILHREGTSRKDQGIRGRIGLGVNALHMN